MNRFSSSFDSNVLKSDREGEVGLDIGNNNNKT